MSKLKTFRVNHVCSKTTLFHICNSHDYYVKIRVCCLRFFFFLLARCMEAAPFDVSASKTSNGPEQIRMFMVAASSLYLHHIPGEHVRTQ